MLAYCACLGVVCFAWRRMFSAIDWQHAILGDMILIPVLLVPALFRHDLRQFDKRDAALTLPWICLLRTMFPWIAALSAGLNLPLRDGLYIGIDRSLGMNVSAVVAWTAAHPIIGALLAHTYYSLFPALLATAVFVPSLAGKRAAAQRFLLSVAFSFLLSLPIFASLPGIGPWVGYQFAPDAHQQDVKLAITALRSGHQLVTAGIVCLPSFHAIWALLSAASLWQIKPLKVPAGLVATLTVVSTITTGWHYVCDVLAALVIAALSLAMAESFRRSYL